MLRTAKSDFIFTLAPGEHQNSENSHSARDGEPAAAIPQSHNLPRLYQFLTVFTKSRPSFTPPLMNDSGSLVEKDVDKAEILNAFFVRQVSQSALDGEPPPINAAPITEDSQLLVSFTISLSDVERALHVLNARKAPGLDGIPTRPLVILKDEIVHCVHHIFTLSLTLGTLPSDRKSATVTPIYKECGNRQVATNYRPISLLIVLSKCLEKLVFKTLYSHLDQFLPIHQSGFRQRDSTAYQLARLVHRLATAVYEGNTNLACFYDLSKVFDRVWHKGLFAKLHHFGVHSHALAWITDYLCDRLQCVRIRNSTSSWLPVPAGVPQGSVLEPRLFLAYTIDLPKCVRHPTQCDHFGDDTALTMVISSPRLCEEHLQQSVTATSTWLSNWRLTVNVEKNGNNAFYKAPLP